MKTRKDRTVSARVAGELRRLVEEEAARKGHSVSVIVEAALRQRYARQLRQLAGDPQPSA